MKYRLTARSIYELGQRDNQEDFIYPPLSASPSSGSLFILCDGMGGHAAGEVASQTVCESMAAYVETHPRADGFFDETDFDAALNAAYDALDAKDTDDFRKMGTTLTFVKFHEGGCFIAHIGDSRIYHIRPSADAILHVTRDHSLVNDLVQLGEMTPEEAKTSRQRNILSRAMQPNQEVRTLADCENLTDLQAGDYIFMCSDGMLEMTEDQAIVNILSLQNSDEEKIEILKRKTEQNRDNHSAHLIRILPQGEEMTAGAPDPMPAPDPLPETEPEVVPKPKVEPEPNSEPPAMASRVRQALVWALALILAFAVIAACLLFKGKSRHPQKEKEHPVEDTVCNQAGRSGNPDPATQATIDSTGLNPNELISI